MEFNLDKFNKLVVFKLKEYKQDRIFIFFKFIFSFGKGVVQLNNNLRDEH